jgi:hypothetical protein
VEAGWSHQERLADRALAVARSGRPGRASTCYLDLSRLTSGYLAHQLVEETQVMPALRPSSPPTSSSRSTCRSAASIPPEEMVLALSHLLPAMNVEERVDMLGGMAMAPPEVFAVFREAAESILPAADFAQVAGRLGLG